MTNTLIVSLPGGSGFAVQHDQPRGIPGVPERPGDLQKLSDAGTLHAQRELRQNGDGASLEAVRGTRGGREAHAVLRGVVPQTQGNHRAGLCERERKIWMRYTFYQGLTQVSSWVKLKFAAMNLKKFAKRKWWESRSATPFAVFVDFVRLFRKVPASEFD